VPCRERIIAPQHKQLGILALDTDPFRKRHFQLALGALDLDV
jgi:hypothetical protein